MKVCVAGIGNMGVGIASLLACSSVTSEVYVLVKEGAVTDNAQRQIKKSLKRSLKEGAEKAFNKVEFISDFGLVTGCDFLFEAVTENKEIKKKFYESLSSKLEKETVVASNTSSMSVEEIASWLPNKENVVGVHFFNPVESMRLVEFAIIESSGQNSIDKTESLLREIDKEVIKVADSPGFIVNKLLIPMINDAVGILEQKVATRDDIDQAMKLGAAHPIGPLKLADLIGIDVVVAILNNLYEGTGRESYKPARMMLGKVSIGELGRKTKRGFYEY